MRGGGSYLGLGGAGALVYNIEENRAAAKKREVKRRALGAESGTARV